MSTRIKQRTFQTIDFYYILLPTLTATQDLVRCDTLHIQYYHHCLTQSRTKVTVAEIFSRGTRNTKTHRKPNTNLSLSYTDTRTNTSQLKHNLRVAELWAYDDAM